MKLRDSRRLTGPNLLWDLPGAVLDVETDRSETEPCAKIWNRQAHRILEAVGWNAEKTVYRIFSNGVSLALSAPLDALYAATEVNEWAWAATERILGGGSEPDLEPDANRLRKLIAEESNPPLLALRSAARKQGAAFLSDDDLVSVGMGTGSRTWAVTEIPEPDQIPWSTIWNIPAALITGTNGKTTTVRLLGSMIEAAGKTPGISSTDWIQVGRQILDKDDWSGPGGARRVLREPKVEIALLETARGGILRRGLAVEFADVSVITNVAEDHLGEWGVLDLDMLADTKFVVTRVGKKVVLNADDPSLVARGRSLDRPLTWFSLDPDNPVVTSHLKDGGDACILDQGRIVFCFGESREAMAEIHEIPITVGGAARHNIANALAAVATAKALGVSGKAIQTGLHEFECNPETNPGRLNQFDLGGVHVLLDYAHNPHGVTALFEMAARLPSNRMLVLLGQAGDREESSIRQLARTVWGARPDRIIIKEMREHLRGREVGEVPRILRRELQALGAGEDTVDFGDTELEAVKKALAWARPKDLLLLLCHAERDAVIELLTRLENEGWTPGSTS